MWVLAGSIIVYLVTFAIHASVTAAIVVATRHIHRVTSDAGMFMRLSSLLTVTMIALVLAHVIEIVVWAGYFSAVGLQTKNANLFEFAFENYTALGYGDALPPEQHRVIGPITALNGLLLIGWSVAVIFEVMRMAELQFGRRNR
jgi:hypothetical protein